MATTRAKRREQRLQSAILDRLTFKYERLITREIARTMASVDLSNVMAIDTVEQQHSERLGKLLNRLWLESGDQMIEHVFGESKKSAPLAMFEPTIGTNAIIRDYVRIYGAAKIAQISRTTANQIKSVINQGVDEGLSERDISRRIRERAPSISASRAQTIARTETHAASNYAVMEAFRSTEIEARREWVSATDERTREDHLEANGQIVGLNEPFNIGGEELMYPGDPSGSGEQVINCRCAVVFVFD